MTNSGTLFCPRPGRFAAICTLLTLISVAGFSVWSVDAGATTLVAMGFDDLAARAGAIVRGRVISVQSEWNEQRTHIFTLATLQADEYMKGDLGPTITVLSWGGRVGPFREAIPGVAQFSVGEEVVLFLSVQPPHYPAVMGLSQGKFTVRADPRTGVKALTRTFYGASIAGQSAAVDAPLTLTVLRARLARFSPMNASPAPAAGERPRSIR